MGKENHVTSFQVVDKKVTSDYQVKTVFVTSHLPAHTYLSTNDDTNIRFFSAIELAENPMAIMKN